MTGEKKFQRVTTKIRRGKCLNSKLSGEISFLGRSSSNLGGAIFQRGLYWGFFLKKDLLDLLAMCEEKLMKQHKSCCYGNQLKEKGNQADQDTPLLTRLEKHDLKERLKIEKSGQGMCNIFEQEAQHEYVHLGN